MGRVEYVVCPLCGMNRSLRSARRAAKGRDEVARFDGGRLPELEEMAFIQLREGGGKKAGTGTGKGSGRGSAEGSGFRLVGGLTLEEALESGDYDEVIEDMRDQAVRVVRGLIRLGLVKKEDI
jgi:hypothetical protein